MKSKHKIIDLFSGAGGFSLGFEMAGFETVLAIDYWEDAVRTFNHNRKNKVAIHFDIKKFDNKKIEEFLKDNEITGIIGGPPCQGFSMVGTRRTDDIRNDLYLEYCRFVDKIRPDFFVIENVKGLLTLANGYYKNDIINRFQKMGYKIKFKVIDASVHGIPQKRERIFFVGFRNKKVEFSFPDEVNKIISTYDALNDLPSLDSSEDNKEYRSLPQNEYQSLMRKNSRKVYNHEKTQHTNETVETIKMVPDGGNIKDLKKEHYKIRNYNTAFKRMNSKNVSITIDCGHRNYFHYSENRVPSVRESARIQSFPDSYEFLASKTSQYTQVGNAVPPLLSFEIAKQIKKILRGK